MAGGRPCLFGLAWHGTRRPPPPLKQEAVSIPQPDTDDWSIMTLVAWARESRGRCQEVSAHPETRHSLDGFPNKCILVHPNRRQQKQRRRRQDCPGRRNISTALPCRTREPGANLPRSAGRLRPRRPSPVSARRRQTPVLGLLPLATCQTRYR